MNLSQAQVAFCPGVGSTGGANEARDHRGQIEAVVEPVLELGEVALPVLWGFEGMVGPSQRSFEVAQQGVDPDETGVLRALLAGAMWDRLMRATGLQYPDVRPRREGRRLREGR